MTVNLAITTAQTVANGITDTLIGFENIQGTAFNDVPTGDGGKQRPGRRGGGDDTLDGGGGNGDVAAYLDATAGVTVSLAISGPQNTVSAGTDTLINIEGLWGSSFNDTLTGRWRKSTSSWAWPATMSCTAGRAMIW